MYTRERPIPVAPVLVAIKVNRNLGWPFCIQACGHMLLYLVTVDITRKWTAPVRDWAKVLNQLMIRFEDQLGF